LKFNQVGQLCGSLVCLSAPVMPTTYNKGPGKMGGKAYNIKKRVQKIEHPAFHKKVSTFSTV